MTDTLGSIPACAGEPGAECPTAFLRTVYPRVCGGTAIRRPGVPAAGGLSPRVRGNRVCRRPDCGGLGSIPACAGEPPGIRPGVRRPEVYPRVCGGTDDEDYVPPNFIGLSPRVRGNRPERERCHFFSVYPRVCGGTGHEAADGSPTSGLSPRVRGNLCAARPRRTAGRSIPACAGEPAGFCAVSILRTVYPRVCGGTSRCIKLQPVSVGLSPRVRGNLG